MDRADGLRWREDILSTSAKDALAYFADCSWLEDSGWYFAGGTALALQAGHRESLDLDFFTQESFDDVSSAHSCRSADDGSIRTARRAGMPHASSATPTRTIVIATNVAGSRGVRPNNIPSR